MPLWHGFQIYVPKALNTYVFHNPKALSPFVTCLIFGVIAAEIGLVDRNPLNKGNSFGWLILVLMAFVLEGLSLATPDMLLQAVLPLAGIIIIEVIGLIIVTIIVGNFLGESKFMSLPIALNALYGFPPNYVLTKETIQSLTEDEEEIQYLTDIMMPKMLIGGFTSVTIASVIIDGVFAGML
ncbi:hypothetical protein [Treponema phagedenis]|uniref:hypothetical protein n=2 Tax=Treponema phagedenis TaxID=162 RepID=UPI001CA392A6|nr:hypothetical protein [Treponema phagedenis]